MRMFLQIAICMSLLLNATPLLFAQDTEANSGKEKQAAEPIRRRRMTPEQENAEKIFIAAQAAYNSGDYAEGLKQFKAANMAFESPRFQNLWAWALATCPDEKLRSPLAVSIADKACEKTDYKDARYLDTLAAAYAQMKDFDSAVKWQTKAVELAPDSKKFAKAELSSVEYRLRLYKRKIPYREVPQSAILAKYKEIVGAHLSAASLKQLDDQDKAKLIDYLKTVPELRYMAAGSTMVEQYPDVLLLMLVSDSMGHQDRYDFTQLLPQWSPEKLDKFRKVLIDEREQLDTIDEQFQTRWNKKQSSE